MNVHGSNYPIIDQAIHNLDLAIRLFYEKEYAGVVLIAGASEESLGKVLKMQRRNNTFQVGMQLVVKSGEKAEDYKSLMNRTKDWLKHAEVDDKFTPVLYCDMEFEAIQYIYRAISNYLDIKGSIRKSHKDFFSFLTQNRPDFKEDLDNKQINIDSYSVVD
jgi:hypothetical protein